MADELDKTIVIDNGSGVVKAGLAGEAIPSVIFPSVIGQPFQQEDPTEEVLYVGDGVAPLAGGVKVRYPLAEGKIKRWDDIELIWDHTFNLLEVEPSYHPVLLTEPPLNPLKNREKMIEIMFEKYQVPGFYVAVQAVLSLYASGRTTGIVMDCGDGVSHTVPVYEGYAIPHAIRRLDVAGRNLTEYMQRLLMLRGYSFTTSAEMELVREIKEKLCFVKHTPTQKQNKQSILATHELLSGEEITIDEERYMCPEALFNPSLIGREAEGIHKLVYSTIQSCDIDLRRGSFSFFHFYFILFE
jgi:actin-related protein